MSVYAHRKLSETLGDVAALLRTLPQLRQVETFQGTSWQALVDKLEAQLRTPAAVVSVAEFDCPDAETSNSQTARNVGVDVFLVWGFDAQQGSDYGLLDLVEDALALFQATEAAPASQVELGGGLLTVRRGSAVDAGKKQLNVWRLELLLLDWKYQR